MIKDRKGVDRFSVPTPLYDFCMRAREKIQTEDEQVLGIVVGDVGCGKSLLAMRVSYIIDPTLDINKVCFTKDEFIKACLKSRKQAVIGDEAVSMFFNRATMTKESRLITEFMNQIRQRNLFLILCIPDLESIDKNIVKAADFVAKVKAYPAKKGTRLIPTKGNARFWIKGKSNKVINLYNAIKRMQSFSYKRTKIPKCNFRVKGDFVGDTFKKPWYPVDEKLYRQKKESVIQKYLVDDEDQGVTEPDSQKKDHNIIKAEYLETLIGNVLKKEPGLTYAEISRRFGITRQTASKHAKNWLKSKAAADNI